MGGCRAWVRVFLSPVGAGEELGRGVPVLCLHEEGHEGEHAGDTHFYDGQRIRLVWGEKGDEDAREVRAAFLSSLPLLGGDHGSGEAGTVAGADGVFEGGREGEEVVHGGDQGPDHGSEGRD